MGASRLDRAILDCERSIRDLPYEVAIAFASDGTVLLRRHGETSAVTFSNADAEAMRKAAVFTHNHPGGSSFSPKDVEFACVLDIGELRAVTADWTHVLRPGPGGWDREYWIGTLEAVVTLASLRIEGELRRAASKHRLAPHEASAEYWHLVWEQVAELEGLDYERYTGERTDDY